MNDKKNEKEQTPTQTKIEKLNLIKYSVLKGQKSLDEVKSEHPLIWVQYHNEIEECFRMFIQDNIPTPQKRLNLVLCGTNSENEVKKGGTGKTTLSYLLADLLSENFKTEEYLTMKNKTFTVQDLAVSFDGYLGEPVFVWEEMRSWKINEWGISQFLSAFNTGKNNFGNFNVKYGKVKLNNWINFINSSQKFSDFFSGLCDRHKQNDGSLSEPENYSQIERRFPFALCFEKHWVSKGQWRTIIEGRLLNDSKTSDIEFSQYDTIFRIEVPTTKDNFNSQLQIIAEWLYEFINLETFEWNFDIQRKSIQDSGTEEPIEKNLGPWLDCFKTIKTINDLPKWIKVKIKNDCEKTLDIYSAEKNLSTEQYEKELQREIEKKLNQELIKQKNMIPFENIVKWYKQDESQTPFDRILCL